MIDLLSSRLLPILLLVIPMLAHAAPAQTTIGFEQGHMPDGTEIGIWYPADGKAVRQRLGLYEQEAVPGASPTGTGLPLVVMSHGSGGSFAGHLDTAEVLARAGFVVAALTHPGDNWRDQSRATRLEARPAALSALVTFMLDAWRFHQVINPARVGAFGFSSGGFTVLAAAGGVPDLSRMAAHCATHPAFYDCALVKAHPPVVVSSQAEPPADPEIGAGKEPERTSGPPSRATAWPDSRDARIKAIIVAAPAMAFTFDRPRLRGVSIPVQLWRAGNDQILPAPFYADAVRKALRRAPEFHNVAGAGHFDFLAPCIADAPKLPICSSAPGFDRAAFHHQFNTDVVRFFKTSM